MEDVIRRWVKALFGSKRISHLVDRAFSLKGSFSQLRNGLRILGDRERRLRAKALQRTGAESFLIAPQHVILIKKVN